MEHGIPIGVVGMHFMEPRVIDSVRIWTGRVGPPDQRYGLVAGLVEDRRGWSQRWISGWSVQPDWSMLREAVRDGLFLSIRHVYKIIQPYSKSSFRWGFEIPDGNGRDGSMWIDTTGIQFRVHGMDFDQHPTMPLRHYGGIFVGDPEDWVIAMSDYRFGSVLKNSLEIITVLRRCKRFMSEHTREIDGLFDSD